MPKLVVVNRAGEEKTVEAAAGLSVMEALRENGFDELLALCGGCCSCATCHVYVDPAWMDKAGARNPMEEDMLDFAFDVRDESRLSCQIKVTDGLDGLVVQVPAKQF